MIAKWTPTVVPVLCGFALTVSSCSADEVGLGAAQIESRWFSSSSSTSVSSAAPESTASETDIAETEIVSSFDALMSRRVQCGRRPATCDVSRLAVDGSEVFARLTELMDDRVTAGITSSDEGEVRYRIESVDLVGSDRAVVTVCLHDDTVLVIDDAVYDDSIYSARSEWSLLRVEGQWLWSEEVIEEWTMEEDLCGII